MYLKNASVIFIVLDIKKLQMYSKRLPIVKGTPSIYDLTIKVFTEIKTQTSR